MDNDELKARKLWQHLKIQDEHLLIRIGTERVLIVSEDGSGGLLFAYVKTPQDGFGKWIREYKQPFTLVQQRNENGCFCVPDIDEWVRDEKIDY